MRSVVHKFEEKINQVTSHYEVPEGLDKKVVLNMIFIRIEEGNNKQQGTSKIYFLSPVYRIAISTAAFLLLIFLLQFFLSTIKISSEDLVAGSYLLPDDSRIVMEFDSKISYPKYWWKREVNLIGDAYFEVKEGKQFTVKTIHGNIEVIGTRFHVKQFKDGLKIQCFEGLVKLSNDKKEQLISEGSSLEFRNNEISESSIIKGNHPELAKFNQYFSQVNIKFVVEEIEYFFNVDIDLQDTTLKKHFSGRIYTSNCDSALQMLCTPLDLRYDFNPNKKIFTIEEL